MNIRTETILGGYNERV